MEEERIADDGIRSFCCAPGMSMNDRVKDPNSKDRKSPAIFGCSDTTKIY